MDVLEEELLEINRDQMFPEEEEEKFAMRSKSVSLAGSTTELHTLSRARSGEDLRSDEDEVGGPHLTDCVPFTVSILEVGIFVTHRTGNANQSEKFNAMTQMNASLVSTHCHCIGID